MSFHQISSRERAKYTMVSRFDRFTTERKRATTFHWLSVLFTSFAHAISADRQLDGQIMLGVFHHSYQKRETKITKSFRSGIINLLFDGFTYNTGRHFARCSYFSSPRKYSATRKISARIIISCSQILAYFCYSVKPNQHPPTYLPTLPLPSASDEVNNPNALLLENREVKQRQRRTT